MKVADMVVSNFEITSDLLSGPAEQDAMPVHVEADFALPSVMTCKFKAPLYYSNAELFMDEVLSIVGTAPPRLRWFVLRFGSINEVDHIAAQMLMELADRMEKQQVALVFAELSADLREFLSDSGVLEVVRADRIFASVDAALAACKLCRLTPRQRWRKMS
jgi:MFS superfamily sulfate permease-like transporter